jgi:hypothetical protein
MTEQLAIVKQEVNPLVILQSALDKGATPEQLVILSDLAEKWEAKKLKAAFDNALSRAQAKIRRIGVDSNNPQTHSKYVSYAKMDAAIRPCYSDEGISLAFNTGAGSRPESLTVFCDASLNGYTKTFQVEMPADGKGAKGGDVMTRTHATVSAVSYGKRTLLNMIFNLAVGETDDDGNAAGGSGAVPKQEVISDENLLKWSDSISKAPSLDEAKGCFRTAYTAATKAKDTDAMKALTTVWEEVKRRFARTDNAAK